MGANLEDAVYVPVAPEEEPHAYFSPRGEGDDLSVCIDLAKSISQKPAIIYLHPFHYMAVAGTPESMAEWRKASEDCQAIVRRIAAAKGTKPSSSIPKRFNNRHSGRGKRPIQVGQVTKKCFDG